MSFYEILLIVYLIASIVSKVLHILRKTKSDRTSSQR